MNLKGDSRMEYRSIKNPATVGSVTPADVEKAAKALRTKIMNGSVRRKLSTHKLLGATPEEVKVSRLSPRLIQSLRRHLGITQKELAILSRVTIGAVQQWESGKFRPKQEKRGAIVALRKMGSREVRKLLERKK
jgi:DNA-binding transcriptional regulator YiaG